MPAITRQIDIDAPASDVWHVLTTRDLVREWAAVSAPEIDVIGGLRPGARITWRAPDQPDRRGVVAAMNADRTLRIEYPQGEGPFRSEAYEVRPAGHASSL